MLDFEIEKVTVTAEPRKLSWEWSCDMGEEAYFASNYEMPWHDGEPDHGTNIIFEVEAPPHGGTLLVQSYRVAPGYIWCWQCIEDKGMLCFPIYPKRWRYASTNMLAPK